MGANTHSNCAGGGGFAMGYNPDVDYWGTAAAENGSSREFFISTPSIFGNGG
jgi:hypothetical protein